MLPLLKAVFFPPNTLLYLHKHGLTPITLDDECYWYVRYIIDIIIHALNNDALWERFLIFDTAYMRLL